MRRAGALVDRTQLKNPNVKVNYQATKKDNVSFLYLDGFKIKDGRSPGVGGITFDAPTATQHQDNAYTDSPFHGLWKVADDHVFGTNIFVTGKYAFYNTGFVLDPTGGLSMQAGRDFVHATSYGSINQSINIRPQHTATVDVQSFFNGFGGSHDLKYGIGWRRVEAASGTLWPGNMILAIERANNLQAQVFRQGYGGNRAQYVDFYVGDTLSRNRWTLDLGLRFDRQNGEALPSETLPSAAFPTVVPGVVFAGYKTPFTWNDWSPRAGFTYALDSSRHTVARVSFTRAAGQLNTGTVGVRNPSSTAGSATYRWVDLNSDHFAQENEVLLDQRITSGGRIQPGQPDGSHFGERAGPEAEGARHQQRRGGHRSRADPEPGAVGVNYSYTRTSRLFGNFAGTITPRTGVTLADYTPGSGFSGTIPLDGGVPYNVATYIPNPTVDGRRRQRLRHHQRARVLLRLSRRRDDAEQAAVESLDGAGRRGAEQLARALLGCRRDLRHQRQSDSHGDRAARGRRAVRAPERRQRRRHDLHQREVAVQRECALSGAVPASS